MTTMIAELQRLAALMRIDERRVLTIAHRALAYNQNRGEIGDVLDRIAELNQAEDERHNRLLEQS